MNLEHLSGEQSVIDPCVFSNSEVLDSQCAASDNIEFLSPFGRGIGGRYMKFSWQGTGKGEQSATIQGTSAVIMCLNTS